MIPNPVRFLAKVLSAATRRRVLTRARVLLACELAGLGLLAAAAWMAFGRAAGVAALGVVLVVVGNSKGS